MFQIPFFFFYIWRGGGEGIIAEQKDILKIICYILELIEKVTRNLVFYSYSSTILAILLILFHIFFQTLVSMFIPKVITTIFVCLFVYVLSMASFHFVNRETFNYLGYYNNMVSSRYDPPEVNSCF